MDYYYKGREALNALSGIVLDSAISVHKRLGPGLLESAYQVCLSYELKKRGLLIETQRPFSIIYDDVALDIGYRVDILVEGAVIVEVKSIDRLLPIHEAQLLSYLKLSGCTLGLLFNFKTERLIDGMKRMVNHI